MAKTEVRERPILFSGPMVRALLEGRKTQTRRVMKPQPICENGSTRWESPRYDNGVGVHYFHTVGLGGVMKPWLDACPYGSPGERLWVRESFSNPHGVDQVGPFWYWADGNPDYGDWSRPKPSIFMPRWACRIELELTKVRVERLQEISVDDVLAEGLPTHVHLLTWKKSRREAWRSDLPPLYRELWDKLNAKRGFGWKKNPWVWVLEFRVRK